MRDKGYRIRLKADLPAWRERGWVTEEGARAILAAVPEGGPSVGLAGIVAGMGAILFGSGILAVVAANWEEIPRFARLVGLMLLLAACFGTAWRFKAKGHPRLAEAAEIVAGLVYGGSIALVAQSYHIAGNASGGVFLWTVGCLVAAALTASRSLLVLSLAGGAAWTFFVTDESRILVHWAGLLPLAAGAALATIFDSPRARRLAVLALAFWAAVALLNAADLLAWRPRGTFAVGAAVALAFWSLGALMITVRDRPLVVAFGRDLRWTALVAALLCVAALQEAFGRHGLSGSRTWIAAAILALIPAIGLATLARLRGGLEAVHASGVAAVGAGALVVALLPREGEMLFRILAGSVVIAAALWAVHLGQSGRQGSARTIGLVLFGVEVFYLYVRTIGSVLDTGLAFLMGGVLFIALATALFRLERRIARPAQGAAA